MFWVTRPISLNRIKLWCINLGIRDEWFLLSFSLIKRIKTKLRLFAYQLMRASLPILSEQAVYHALFNGLIRVEHSFLRRPANGFSLHEFTSNLVWPIRLGSGRWSAVKSLPASRMKKNALRKPCYYGVKVCAVWAPIFQKKNRCEFVNFSHNDQVFSIFL